MGSKVSCLAVHLSSISLLQREVLNGRGFYWYGCIHEGLEVCFLWVAWTLWHQPSGERHLFFFFFPPHYLELWILKLQLRKDPERGLGVVSVKKVCPSGRFKVCMWSHGLLITFCHKENKGHSGCLQLKLWYLLTSVHGGLSWTAVFNHELLQWL